jgi:PKD repeat protein
MILCSKSRTISLVVGLVLMALILPGTVSAYSTYSTYSLNAQVISTTIPSSMVAGQSYPVSVTMKNTGRITWDEASLIRLGGINDGSSDANKFGTTLIKIPTGTKVLPGAQYTFTFTMTAPASAGSYVPKYRMVRNGYEWFGAQVTKTIQVVNQTAGVPIAAFTANKQTGTAPLADTFTDQSTGTAPLTYAWDFTNDGTTDSTTRNPSFTYSTAGTYTVKLTTTNAAGSDAEIKTGYITVSSAPVTPIAAFTANKQTGTAPLAVTFTDQSTGTASLTYAWDFTNDGTTDSTTRNPSFTYSAAGTYTVKLTTTNAAGSDTEIKINYITISPPSTGGETFGAESNPTGNPIGGGGGYTNIISASDPRVKYSVSTKDQLLNALKNVRSGDIIFVNEDANIDLTGIYATTIPGGVTLASNRGSNGSPGGRIFQNRLTIEPSGSSGDLSSMLKTGGDNVRITGLRIEGPDKTTDNSLVGDTTKTGIYVRNYQGFEADNCEILGWSGAGVNVNIWNTSLQTKGLSTPEIGSSIANIHHNYIHNCLTNGAGYGVVVYGGAALIKANLFDYTRHAVADSGAPTDGYEASYNIYLGHSNGHVFDVHGYSYSGNTIAGNLYNIHHNTVKAPVPSQIWWAVGIRGLPLNQVYINFNDFQSTTVASVTQHAPPVFQLTTGGAGHVTMTKNIIDGVYSAEGPIRLRADETTDWW